MPPIPIHKNAPIKPDGVTPQTASEDASNPPPTRTTPAYVPASTTASADSPPAPQPGARPIPPTQQASSNAASTASPAPPQPGYTAHHITTETRLGGRPPQFTQPPPSDAMLAGRSTTTSTTASNNKPGPTTLNYGPVASPFQSADAGGERRSLEHPPGYQQAPDNAPYNSGGGIGGHSGEGSGDGVGAAAWNMLSRAGEALKKGEEAAWKAVRNK